MHDSADGIGQKRYTSNGGNGMFVSHHPLLGIKCSDDYGLFYFPTAEAERYLYACIGCTNLKVAAGDPKAGNGPIA